MPTPPLRLRLERDCVLKSWAVPKIPEVGEKRLAWNRRPPLRLAKFAGEIPKGEYGAGQVVIWVHGRLK
jgi:bifunctional non-homologous end joining protein LigD